MDWKELYQQKLVTADEAVKHIKSGDRVVVTHATGESPKQWSKMLKTTKM